MVGRNWLGEEIVKIDDDSFKTHGLDFCPHRTTCDYIECIGGMLTGTDIGNVCCITGRRIVEPLKGDGVI
jgi:hypothetical protein